MDRVRDSVRWFARLVVVLAIWPTWAVAGNALDQLNQFNEQVQQASGQFFQTVVSASGEIKQQGRGTFVFSKPGKFRWEVVQPFPQLVISDGEFLFSFDPDLEQATKRRVSSSLGSSPSALLFGYSDLESLFSLREDSEGFDDVSWLEALPKEPESLYEKIRIGMVQAKPVFVHVHDALGQVTQLQLLDWNLEPELDAQTFEFVLPEGADLIEVN